MYFGRNLQFLRKMKNLTQEELAEKMNVTRQTVSKWETDSVYPEIDKLIELCEMFSCTVDRILREDMNVCGEAYSEIRTVTVEPMRYIRYTVISEEPESDAISRAEGWAKQLDISEPRIIGWDFPHVTQEQNNVFHMHGYTAALLLDSEQDIGGIQTEILSQDKQKYVTISITEPFEAPFHMIPNAYKALLAHMEVNGIKEKHDPSVIPCFEKEYVKDGIQYMDIYIAAE